MSALPPKSGTLTAFFPAKERESQDRPKKKSCPPESLDRPQGAYGGQLEATVGQEKNLLSAKASQAPHSHPVWQIAILAIAPTIGLGIGRFAYALVLPDMRDSLGWSYSMAGFMNTINAAGYLAGALGASAIIKRFGMFNIIRISAAACVLSLVISALG